MSFCSPFSRLATSTVAFLSLALALRAQSVADASADAVGGSGALLRLDDYIVETNPATFRQKAPAVTHQILGEDLDALNLPETGDALQYLPNLFIRKRFIGDKNSLTSIRGTSNRQPGRTLVLADGILLSNFLGTGFGNSPRWFLIAPEEIEKIAISYGPYSALYAGNSIGGTVLFTTSLPSRFTATAKAQYFVEDFSEYATKGTFSGKTGYVSVGDRQGKFSYFVFVNHLDNDSQPMTFNTANVSATSAPGTGGAVVTGALTDADFSGNPRIIYGSQGPTQAIHDLFKAKLGYDLTDDLHLRYSLIYWTNQENNLAPESYLRDGAGGIVTTGKIEAAGRTFTIPANAFTVNRRRQADVVNAFTLAHEPATGLQCTFSGSLYDVMKDKTYAATTSVPSALNGGAGLATIVGRTGWQNADVLLGWRDATGAPADHALAGGYHLDHFFTQQNQWNMTDWRDPSSRTSLSGGNGGDTRTQAFYLQDAWSIAPAWILTPGVRWERWEAFNGYRAKDFSGTRVSTIYADRSGDAFSPKGALAWHPAKDWSVRLSLARAVRFPTVGELFQGSISASGSITQNDPNLKPERDFAKDLTVERAINRGSVRVSVFEEDVRDALTNQSTLLPDGTSFTGVQNVGQVRTRGAEFAFEQKKLLNGRIDFEFNASYTNAVTLQNAPILVGGVLVSTVGKQFPRIPHWQVKSVTTWHATSALGLSVATRYSSHQFNTLENSDPYGGYGGTDAFFVVDLKASYRFPHGLTASVGIDNVNDDRYHVFHPMPARTWFAEANWRL
jgi:iron complex outermembrane recepter protein